MSRDDQRAPRLLRRRSLPTSRPGRGETGRWGAATTDEVAPPSLTVDNLYHEALRHFRRALELTNEKKERDQLQHGDRAPSRRRWRARRAGL